MRLSNDQVKQIHQVLKDEFNGHIYRLYLYGSRIHSELKGGDIDLLIVTDINGLALFKEIELSILVKIKKQPAIGQRRIDLKAALQEDLEKVPFLREISKEMIELNLN